MGLFDRFPWVNTHELNLDWIIQKMKEWGKESAENVAAARTAAENAATTAEPYAVRAEEASTRAASRALDCLTYVANCKEYSESAETAKTEAITAKTSAESNASKAERAFKAASLSADGAAASAHAAAVSAEEAKTATKWPYSGSYKGYLYKTLDSTDSYTNSNREFLNPPQDNGVLFRVSGNIPKRCSINDSTNYEYHYEKIIKISGTVAGSKLNFSEQVGLSIANLQISEAEVVGMVVFDTSSGSFYKYSKLPVAYLDGSGAFHLYSKGFDISDDRVLDISFDMTNESVEASAATAYLYVRVKYTF